MGKHKNKNTAKPQETNMKEIIDPKTGGDYVDFDVDDPDEEKPATEIKTNDRPLSERNLDNGSKSSGKK